MFYIYVIKCVDNKLYVGFSSNLKQRIISHSKGNVISTRNRRPIQLIYYECFHSKIDAINREKFLKSGHGREQLHSILKNTIKNLH